MKTYRLFLLMILIALSASVSAQSKLSNAQREQAKVRYEAYQAQLNLSEEQTAKVEAINSAYFKGLSDLRNADGSRLAKYRKYKDLTSARDKQMKDVLTREQYQLYKNYQAEMREEFRENRRTH